jgi:hypothetical protein
MWRRTASFHKIDFSSSQAHLCHDPFCRDAWMRNLFAAKRVMPPVLTLRFVRNVDSMDDNFVCLGFDVGKC